MYIAGGTQLDITEFTQSKVIDLYTLDMLNMYWRVIDDANINNSLFANRIDNPEDANSPVDTQQDYKRQKADDLDWQQFLEAVAQE